MSTHILDKVILLPRIAAQNLPQPSGLDKVLIRDRDLLGDGGTGPLLVFLRWLDGLVGEVAVGGGVVGVGAVVSVDGHDAVALVGIEGAKGRVDGNLLVVDAQAVAVGVWVGEQAGLKDRVGGGLDPRDHVGGREGYLLDLGEVVLRVAVELELAEGAEWYFTLGPDFGQVEDVPAEFFSLLGAEDLDVAGPRGTVPFLNGFEEVLSVPVGVLRGHLAGLFVGEGLAALIRLAMDLDVVKCAIWLSELIRVSGVSVHVSVGIRGTAIREEMHDLVSGLLVG